MRKFLLPVLALSLVAAGLSACSKDPGPGPAADQFLKGWSTGNFGELPLIRPNGDKVTAAVVLEEMTALSGTLKDARPELKRGRTDDKDGQATAEIAISQPISGGKWDYTSTLKLTKGKDAWQVVWEPTVVHPQLAKGERLETRRLPQARSSILAGNGEELVKLRPVAVIGIWPAKIVGDKAAMVAALASALEPVHTVDNVDDLTARAANPANADQFIQVVPLRKEIYDQVAPQVEAIRGVLINTEERMLSESRGFASALLGSVGAVTAEIMQAKPGVYLPNDQVGLAGLQSKYDLRLRGQGGVKVVIARKAADGTTQDTELYSIDAAPGQPLKTTLDPRVQRAADFALTTVNQRGALVAVKISDGSILAVANKTDLNLAFTAQVPPGSTFKAVTAVGLLENGKVTADQIVDCPQFYNVPGRPPIHNAGQFSLGAVPFSVDFYKSCNTAFAKKGPELGPDGLAKAGASLGLGLPWDLGVEAFSGKVSANGDPGEQAAASFGQGTTIVSPVAMAGVAAAIARGQWKQPFLLLDVPTKPAADAPTLKPSTVDPMKTMMRQVITDGTATQLLDVNPPVSGKTGTAEYVSGDPSKTHAWFIGWQGDIAFAVFVEQGVKPAETALPITESFLRTLTP